MNISTGKMQCPQCYNLFTNLRALRYHSHRQHSNISEIKHCHRAIPVESSHLLPDVNLSQGTEADLNEGTEADLNEDTEARYLHFQRTCIDKLREHARQGYVESETQRRTVYYCEDENVYDASSLRSKQTTDFRSRCYFTSSSRKRAYFGRG